MILVESWNIMLKFSTFSACRRLLRCWYYFFENWFCDVYVYLALLKIDQWLSKQTQVLFMNTLKNLLSFSFMCKIDLSWLSSCNCHSSLFNKLLIIFYDFSKCILRKLISYVWTQTYTHKKCTVHCPVSVCNTVYASVLCLVSTYNLSLDYLVKFAPMIYWKKHMENYVFYYFDNNNCFVRLLRFFVKTWWM